jgi:2-polyprenyl-3-methyl-5-hydroxy-6-metoxy-1,4-benzoquinol methylase
MKPTYKKYLKGRWLTIYNMLPSNASKILDYGSNNGTLSEIIREKYKVKTYGAEIDEEYIRQGKKENPKIKFLKIIPGRSLKIKKIDLIILSDVIEHIPKGTEQRLIKELHSYTHKNGFLILSTPNKDPLNINFFIDPANFFIKPLVSFIKLLKIPSQKKGEKYLWEKNNEGWHRHYTIEELEIICRPYFKITEIKRRGSIITPIFYFILLLGDMPLAYLGNNRITKLLRKIWSYIPEKIISFDLYHTNLGPFSYHTTVKLRRET